MRAPLLTLALVALALLASAWPTWAEALRLERAAVARGELWRLLTGHLVHASLPLAATDLVVLALLGLAWEGRDRRTCAGILGASALCASLAILAGDLACYSGSSALGTGLFAAAGVARLGAPSARARSTGWLLLVLLGLKTVLELRGSALFVALPEGTRLAVEAHLGGGLAGALVALRACRPAPVPGPAAQALEPMSRPPTTLRVALALSFLASLAALPGCRAEARDPVRITDVAGIDQALEARRGQPCLVNFWATWCPPCVAELPELLAVAAEFEGRATVLGVSFDLMRPTDLPEPTLAKVRQFLASRNLAFETLICERSDLGNLIGRFALPDGIPITHAYDAQGKLVDSHFGIGSRERFAEMMNRALGR